MKTSLLVKVISSFNAHEIREFSRLMNSPYFNGRKDAARFWSVLKKFYPGFSGSRFSAEKVFSDLFPDSKFDIAEIRRLSSYTLKLAEQFMAYKGLKNDPFYFDLSLSVQYSERGFYGRSMKKLEESEKRLNAERGDYEFYFWKRYLIERQKNSLYSYTGNDHLASESIIARTDMFSYHAAAVTCKSLISLFINEKNFNTDYTNSNFYQMVKGLDLEKYINFLSESNSEYYPVLAAEYYEAMALVKPENENYYVKFREVMNGDLGMFTYLEKLNFYTIFEAICTLKIENGEDRIADDLFNVYNRMLAEGLYSYSPDGVFILRIFRNIVHMAILVKKYAWLEKFLDDYAWKLPDDSAGNMKNLADSLLHFEKGKFDLSLDKLNRIDYELFHFKIDVKNLQLKLFYELDYHEELISAADTYRHFIMNNRYISQRYKMLCSGFVNFLVRLNRLKAFQYSEIECEILRNEIVSSKGFLFKHWLLEKADEIIKNNK